MFNVNKFVQGSIWRWVCKMPNRPGVQGSERPVLIISNDTFNQFSPSVNCVTITSVLKESPVHVPVHITKDSHIQCEQVHTVTKEELTEFMGMVNDSIMLSVKSKLKYQFNMAADRNLELLNSIKHGVDNINSRTEPEILNTILLSINALAVKADSGFGLHKIEEDLLKMVSNLYTSIEKIVRGGSWQASEEVAAAVIQPVFGMIEDTSEDISDNGFGSAVSSEGVKGRRRYSEEDKLFIADKTNSIKDLVERYGFTENAAYRMRAYFRARLGLSKKDPVTPEMQVTQISNRKGVHRKYSDADRKFILDENNTLEDLMKMFDYKDKNAAYKARAYIQKSSASATG